MLDALIPNTNPRVEEAESNGVLSKYGCALVFLIAVFFCWLLSLAYPQGLVNEETLTYWLLQKDFHWFAANQFDWYRTIPFGALLWFCSHFRNATSVYYWFNSLIFSADSALLFVLGRLIFSSSRKAFVLAVLAILFEVVSMRTFYNNLGLSPDSNFGELIWLGTLLGLIGWFKRRPAAVYLASAVFGLIAFAKPAGMSLWFVWIPFSLCFFHLFSKSPKQKYLGMLLAVALMTGPILLWSARNYCIYGYAKSTGLGGCLSLQGVLPLMSDKDQLFDDARTNADFHMAYKQCEANYEKYWARPEEKASPNLSKILRFERCFLYGPSVINPFQVLATMTDPQWRRVGYQDLRDLRPSHMFKMDAEAGRVTFKIVTLHPVEYVQRVITEYTLLFCPLEMWTNPLYSFQANPQIAYNYWDRVRQGPRPKYPGLYGGNDYPEGLDGSISVANFLDFLHSNLLVASLLNAYYASELWVSHLIFFAAVLLFFLAHKLPAKFTDPLWVSRITFTLIVLFLTSDANFLLVASFHVAKFRYQLASDMMLHAMFLIAVIAAVPVLVPKSWLAGLKEMLARFRGNPVLLALKRQITSRYEQLDRKNLLDFSLFTGIFLLAIFFCWMLSLAYPQGFINEETIPYWWQQFSFDWFGPNRMDYYRTICYGALLHWCTQFANPTNALYWVNSLVFSFDCALVFILGRLLFASYRFAVALALSALVFEVVSMRTFYNNLGVSPDALLADLIYLAALLGLIGWFKRSVWIFLSAYAVFGLVAFLKPMGSAPWIVWLPFAILFAWRQKTQLKFQVLIAAASIVLATGPLNLWCLRNYLLYGTYKSAAVAGCCLLQQVMPIMTDDEQLFDDASVNANFHMAAKECVKWCEKKVATPEEKTCPNLYRVFTYERYYFYGPSPINPFQILATLADPSWKKTGFHWLAEFEPAHMFKIDAEAGRVAWRVILDHPLAYIQWVAREYVDMFSPLQMWTNPLYVFQSNPSVAYHFWDYVRQGARLEYPALYPRTHLPSGAYSNGDATKLLSGIHDNFLSHWFLNIYYSVEFFVSHLIFIGALVLYTLAFRHPERFADPVAMRRIALASIMLFLTAASSYLLIALYQIARLRYQLAGDMPLHLLLIIGVLVCVPELARRLVSSSPWKRLRQLGLKPLLQK